MKENLHKDLNALIRIIAFAIAKCESGADDLIEWAYCKDTKDDGLTTEEFVEKYLSTDKRVSAQIKKELISRFIENHEAFAVQAVKAIILHMPYEDFLKTPYWKATAQYVKNRDYNRCCLCGNQKRLHVHHKTYQHHGDEIHNLDDLITLCRDCHNKTHYERRIYKNSESD